MTAQGKDINMKTLVAYFSAESGRTASLAEKMAAAIGADLFEIKPEKPYSAADLNYMNPVSRCNREFFAKKQVPVSGKIQNFEDYDLVLIGFPIWYGCAPLVVNTFCAGYDWTGKKVAAFATSGGSGIGKTAAKLAPYVKGADIIDARLLNGAGTDEIKAWVESL